MWLQGISRQQINRRSRCESREITRFTPSRSRQLGIYSKERFVDKLQSFGALATGVVDFGPPGASEIELGI